VHLITLTLQKKQKLFQNQPNLLNDFIFVLQQAMRADVRQANKRDIKTVQSSLVREYIRQQA
jgi:hypothetical protein